ncbi:MAG: hypothetical protein EBT48_01750 [Verrucomicrobia bacterium]|nr:hypothetical protein [Verrucomicrobiota bacterium]NDE69308.1 hypothetical protein [Microbacteriaceae bacterium]
MQKENATMKEYAVLFRGLVVKFTDTRKQAAQYLIRSGLEWDDQAYVIKTSDYTHLQVSPELQGER